MSGVKEEEKSVPSQDNINNINNADDSFKSSHSTGSNISSVTVSSDQFVHCKLYDNITNLKTVYSEITDILCSKLSSAGKKANTVPQPPAPAPGAMLMTEEQVDTASKKLNKPDVIAIFVKLLNVVRPICLPTYTPDNRPKPCVQDIRIASILDEVHIQSSNSEARFDSIEKQLHLLTTSVTQSSSSFNNPQQTSHLNSHAVQQEVGRADVAKLVHGMKHIDSVTDRFIADDFASELQNYLSECNFVSEGGRSVAAFGETYKYNGSRNDAVAFPDPVKRLLDKLNATLGDQSQPLNSCVINKYDGPESYIPTHSDNERCIDPNSRICTVSLGEKRLIEFTNTLNPTEKHVHEATHCSLYTMSRKSQDVYKHGIPVDSQAVGIRYSLTFRTVSWRYHKSTVVVGDSNTAPLTFCAIDHTGRTEGTFGKSMPGERVTAFEVEEIDPVQCLGYNNVVVHCGINSIRKDHVRSHDHVEAIFDQFKYKLSLIKKLNKNCKLFVCPLLPTKNLDYNRKANIFNNLLRNDLVNTNLGVIIVDGFDSFLDKDRILSKDLSSSKTGDTLHLNGKGYGQLARLIKSSIFQDRRRGNRIVSNRLFTSAVSGGQVVI